MSKDLSAHGIAPEDWHHLHPLTYARRVVGTVGSAVGVATVANASAIVSWMSGDEVASEFNVGAIFMGIAAIAAIVAAVSCLYCYLSWKTTRYAVTSTAVWYRCGIYYFDYIDQW